MTEVDGSEKSKKDEAGEQTPEEAQKAEDQATEAPSSNSRPWLRPLLISLAFLVAVAGLGFGLGYLTASGDSGPDLSPDEAYTQAKLETRKEVRRTMAKRGFQDGVKSGKSHGIIAGGMAAESVVTILLREQRASSAWSTASSAQAELAGISSGPPPPVP